jgi:DNA-directed RNA polymerase
MTETHRRSAERFTRRNRLMSAKNRHRHVIQTPQGNALACDLIGALADFLAGKLDAQPDKPPPFLRKAIREILQEKDGPKYLALAALAPLLDGIIHGWDGPPRSVEGKLKLKAGEDLYRRLRQDRVARHTWNPKQEVDASPWQLWQAWSTKQKVNAGNWLLRQALRSSFFDHDDDGLPCISAEGEPQVAQLCKNLIAADPVYAPLLKPPAPWVSWDKSHDGFQATFVRDWHPETKKALDVAFLNPLWDHARGVNVLASVPLKIDPVMVKLVEQFAVEIMGNKGQQRRADGVAVIYDLEHAGWIGERTFWNDHNCDFRGRIYALQHLNFGRADHVRSLFKFENGLKLANDALRWLEIHCANCEGSTDKDSRAKRLDWVRKHDQDIKDIAKDPVGTFDRWRKAKEQFAYVAACRELAAAWADPDNFVTHLPIAFDGSANGIQHLALLARDPATAALVNLFFNGEDPSDAYRHLIAKTVELIDADNYGDAAWWRARFKSLDDDDQRTLLKTPIMTYAYSVTVAGAADQIAEVYKSFRRNEMPTKSACRYLAEKVLEACAEELSGPADVMKYLRLVAEHCTGQDRFMEWTSPTGFPVSNRYQKPNMITVNCMSGGVRVRHDIADGVTPEIRKGKVKSSASPNFVHSLDAAHLIKVVNASAGEGITDLLTVHDSFSCLAPQAGRLHEIILEQLFGLYNAHDPLAELRSRNVSGDILPVPPKGTLLTFEHGSTTFSISWADGKPLRTSFPLWRVKDAKNAFG